MVQQTDEIVGSSDQDEEKKDPPASETPVEDENGEEEQDEDDGEEEYEIEAILDAKRGAFGKGKFGYLVKWKGYGEEHNSWVSEDDAGNAKELISEYWRVQERSKKRKSIDGKPAKASPSIARSINSKERSPVETVAGIKRGRRVSKKPDTPELEEVDELAEDDDSPKPAKKKPKRSSLGNGKHKPEPKAISQEPDSDDADMDSEKPKFSTMEKYMSDSNWEHLVDTVDTVERVQSGELVIFFTLGNGERIREKSSLCAKRFPQKLIKFYESNLRWRQAEEES